MSSCRLFADPYLNVDVSLWCMVWSNLDVHFLYFSGGFDKFSTEFPEMCTKPSPPQGLSLPLSSSHPGSADPGCSPCNTPLYDQVSIFILFNQIAHHALFVSYFLLYCFVADLMGLLCLFIFLFRVVLWRSCLSCTSAVLTMLQEKTCLTCLGSAL